LQRFLPSHSRHGKSPLKSAFARAATWPASTPWSSLRGAAIVSSGGSSGSIRRAAFQAATSAFSPTFFEDCRYEYRHGRRDSRATARVIMGII
jgi:hypothetical protein